MKTHKKTGKLTWTLPVTLTSIWNGELTVALTGNVTTKLPRVLAVTLSARLADAFTGDLTRTLTGKRTGMHTKLYNHTRTRTWTYICNGMYTRELSDH